MSKTIHIPQITEYTHDSVFSPVPIILHSIAALMLFPNEKDQQNCKRYMALCFQHLLLERVRDGQHKDKIFSVFLKVLSSLFADQSFTNPFSCRQAAAFEDYTATLHEARFAQTGKGSLQERFIRGFFAGIMLNLALTEEISLTKAAKRLEDTWPDFRNEEPELQSMAPDVTQTNLLQNIWPVFKDVAHMWAALQDFSYTMPSVDDIFCPFNLQDLTEKAVIWVENPETSAMINIPTAIWPSQGCGWYTFLHKANHILDVGLGKDGSKPLLSEANCWHFVLPDSKSS